MEQPGAKIRPLSEHCQIPNIEHGPHWCPEAMLGDMMMSDLCLGTDSDAEINWRADQATTD